MCGDKDCNERDFQNDLMGSYRDPICYQDSMAPDGLTLTMAKYELCNICI